MQLLIIEDEAKVAKSLKRGFAGEGIDAAVAATGEDGYFLATTRRFDAIVLDWNLPGRDGMEILKTLRAKGDQVPVLLLTARDAVEDRVAGLDAGADDYLVKPFSFAELLARLRALLRRGRGDTPLRLFAANLELDLATRRVVRGERVLSLTVREFELLEHLLRAGGQIVTRDMLARDVWQHSLAGTGRPPSLDNLIDVQIARLRRKLEEPGEPRLLHTVRGVGFVLRDRPP